MGLRIRIIQPISFGDKIISQLYSIRQKVDYIHNNPVVEGMVYHAVDYVYSSASIYMDEKKSSKLPIELLNAYYLLG